jgi:DNA invertase Pin-like site-specific DNA recombinase
MRAAIYARFSTDRQSESSIDDQYRVCSERCAKESLQVVARFEDQGISGAAIGNRPGFLAMVDAANAGRFDVLLVMDLSRLSRSQGDLSKVIDRLTSRGVRVIGVQDGYDNARKGHKLQAGLSGIIGEAFRDMIGERTYAALESRALQGRSAGGKSYGYGDGEADVVRQIFDWYASGRSAPWIAAELNRRGVPSPGSTWNRATRRRGGWAPSAISGDPRRGVGILNNEVYVGRKVWNRAKWVKDPDTGKRRQVLRPRGEWIVREDEALRIVPQATWDAVKHRQRVRQTEVGDKIRKGIKKGCGRAARYAFSTLIKCEVCGSNLVMADRRSYQCSGYLNGRICTNDVRVRRDVLESRLTASIQRDLLRDVVVDEFRSRLGRALRQRDPASGKRQQLEREVQNIVEAIGKGLLSPALSTRLQTAERELEAMPATGNVVDVKQFLKLVGPAVETYRQRIVNLPETITRAPDVARKVIRDGVGPIVVEPRKDANGSSYLVAKMGLELQPLLAAGGLPIDVVAGARFGNYVPPCPVEDAEPGARHPSRHPVRPRSAL